MKKITISLFLVFLTFLMYGQVDKSNTLVKTIQEKDSLLFELGFNSCNTKILQELVSENFTFYHDQAGVIQSKDAFIESIQNGLCQLPYKAFRVLNTSSQAVYPLKRNDTLYGAIQNGEHSFYALESDNQKYLTSVAKFTHLWMIENGKWKLHSVLSYDHQNISKKDSENGLFIDNGTTNNWLKRKNIPSVGIGFIDHGEIVQTSVFGEREPGKAAPLNTIWNVASLTKPIVALITLKAIDSSLLGLDEPIANFYTDQDLKTDSRFKQLTPRIILSHQTGLPNWRGDTPDGKLKFEFTPGEKYQYSGEGYDLLRKALESKFNKSIQQLAEELIFEPLGMTNTSFVWTKEMDEKPFAMWHNATGKLYELDKFYEANGADNLLTTIEDYSRFVLYILQGAELSEDLQKEMVADQVRVSTLKHFGLGWWVDENINEDVDFALAHGGDDIGVHCIVFILPNSEKALIVFSNSDNGTDAYLEIINHYLEEDAKGIINAEMN